MKITEKDIESYLPKMNGTLSLKVAGKWYNVEAGAEAIALKSALNFGWHVELEFRKGNMVGFKTTKPEKGSDKLLDSLEDIRKKHGIVE